MGHLRGAHERGREPDAEEKAAVVKYSLIAGGVCPTGEVGAPVLCKMASASL